MPGHGLSTMEQLKAGCLALAQEALKPPNLFDPHSKAVTEKLENVLHALEIVKSSLSPTVAEYVFFPLRGLLQQNKLGDRQTELLFNILTILCENAWNPTGLELERAQQLLAVTTFLLSPDPPSAAKELSIFFSKPESYRAAGFQVLHGIFSAAKSSGFVNKLIGSPITAQVIALSLEALNHDTSLDSQLGCLNTLIVVLQQLTAEHLALVLPGVVSNLSRFVDANQRRHFRAKTLAIRCLQISIINSIGDNTWSEDNNNNNTNKVRTDLWITTTITNLTALFSVIHNLQTSLLELTGSKSELLAVIYDFAHNVFLECSKTFNNQEGKQHLIEIMLLTTSQTTDLEMARKALIDLKNARSIVAYLDTVFVSWVQQLPSIVDTANESKALNTLKSVQNAITMVEGNENLELLIEAVESSLPLSIKRTIADGNLPTITGLDVFNAANQQKSQKAITFNDLGLILPLSTSIQQGLAAVLREIKSPRAVELLYERLETLKLRQKHSLDSVVLLWISGCIISGMPRGSDVYDLVTYCFDDVLQSLNVYDTSASTPASAAHTALACYVIGEAALVQGAEFKEYLVDLVHPLFTSLGNTNSLAIREQAALSISKIAYACGYQSPMALALDTKDYLVDGISLQLNTLNITPSTLQALSTLIYISGADIVPYLDDVFASLFVLLDHYHGYSRLVTGIMNAFRALVFVVEKTHPVDSNLIENSSMEVEFPSFASLVEELHRKPKINPDILNEEVDLNTIGKPQEEKEKPEAPNNDSDDSDAMSEESDEPEEFDKPEDAVEKWDFPVAKPVYMILLRISKYCDRLMTHESSEIRVATLELVSALVPFLAVNKEEFLPLVHKTWPEAVERVFDNEVYVVEQGFICLSAIATYASNFVASRLEDLWPKLLRKYAPLLQRKWPQFAPERRSLNSLTTFAASTIAHIPELSFMVVEEILVAYRPALLRNEYKQLQLQINRSKPSFRDLMWLVLLDDPVVAKNLDLHTILPIYKTI